MKKLFYLILLSAWVSISGCVKTEARETNGNPVSHSKALSAQSLTSCSNARYVALLTQTGTGAPVATILENSLGNVVWGRHEDGLYFGTLTGAFTEDKTVCFIGTGMENINNGNITGIVREGENTVLVATGIVAYGYITQRDELLYKTPVTIEVYE